MIIFSLRFSLANRNSNANYKAAKKTEVTKNVTFVHILLTFTNEDISNEFKPNHKSLLLFKQKFFFGFVTFYQVKSKDINFLYKCYVIF